MKDYFRRLLRKLVHAITKITDAEDRRRRNIDLALSSALKDNTVATLNDPYAFVDFLRVCVEPSWLKVRTVKRRRVESPAAARFQTLIDVIKRDQPPVPFPRAFDIGLAADRWRGLTAAVPDQSHYEPWYFDAGLQFATFSSNGAKGRFLSTVVRFCRPRHVLELGTAYGISATFIMEAQRALGIDGTLTTIDAGEAQFALATEELGRRYGGAVSAHLGLTKDVLSKIALGRIDFMFHDAGHSREDYVNDFNATVDALAPGAVVLIDDIRWEDPRLHKGAANCYQGWLEVAKHPRVVHAVEIQNSMGLMLLV